MDKTEKTAKAKVVVKSLLGERRTEIRPAGVSTKNDPRKPGSKARRLEAIMKRKNVAIKGRIFLDSRRLRVTASVSLSGSKIKTRMVSAMVFLAVFLLNLISPPRLILILALVSLLSIVYISPQKRLSWGGAGLFIGILFAQCH